jgi:RNA polymerase sigma factor (TIGR02999 family)
MTARSDSDRSESSSHPLAETESGELTLLLNNADSARDGLDQAFDRVYVSLKQVATNVLGRDGNYTLNPTALVHEAYAKLIDVDTLSLAGRKHFFSLCARTMRQISTDHARRRLANKRGGGLATLPLTDEGAIDLARPEAVLAMDMALTWLGERDHRLMQLLEYRVFGGLSLEEISPLTGVSVRQLQRDWQRARAWLVEALEEPHH